MAKVETFAVRQLGDGARFDDIERWLIADGLSGTLTGYDLQQLERYSRLMAPLMLAAGFGLYGLRLRALIYAQQQPAWPDDAPPPAPESVTRTAGTENRQAARQAAPDPDAPRAAANGPQPESADVLAELRRAVGTPMPFS